jgi:hypothetical protein
MLRGLLRCLRVDNLCHTKGVGRNSDPPKISLGPQQKLIARLEATFVAKYAALSPLFKWRARRLWAAAESVAIGYGGDAVVSSATGLSRTTIPVAAANWSTAGRQRAVSGSPAPYRRLSGLTCTCNPVVANVWLSVECLNEHWFTSLAHAQVIIEA